MAAVGVGYLIYIILAGILALRADASTLLEDPLVMRRMAFWGDAVLLGVWGATLSSAVGSILAAPRVLQALARDGVLTERGRWLGRGSGARQEPRIGTLLTLGIALVAVLLGDLNAIAPILTVFFLTTYLILNLASGIEGLVASPSFRPAFRVHWALSLLGAAGCLVVMFMINPVASVVAAVVVLSVYLWLEQRGMRATWRDVRGGVWLMLLRSSVLRLRGGSGEDWRTWRPNPLVLSDAPTRRWHLIDFANSLTQGRGLITVASVLPEESWNPARQEKLEGTIRDFLARRGVQALVRLVAAEDSFRGARYLVDSYGMGGFKPNTIVLGDSEREDVRANYCELIDSFHRGGRNVVIVHDEGTGFGKRERIDVWWGGMQRNGGLMLLMSHLLRRSVEWSNAEINVKLMVPEPAAREKAEENLTPLLERMRVDAEGEVLLGDGRSFKDVLALSSRGADLVMLGMAEPGLNFSSYYDRLHHHRRWHAYDRLRASRAGPAFQADPSLTAGTHRARILDDHRDLAALSECVGCDAFALCDRHELVVHHEDPRVELVVEREPVKSRLELTLWEVDPVPLRRQVGHHADEGPDTQTHDGFFPIAREEAAELEAGLSREDPLVRNAQP